MSTAAGGMGSVVSGYLDGMGTLTKFSYPSGVFSTSVGDIIVADTGNNIIRKILSTGFCFYIFCFKLLDNFIAQSLPQPHFLQKPLIFQLPTSSFVVIFICNQFSMTGLVSTVAGGGRSALYGYADGFGSMARFNQPYGVSSTLTGDIIVADADNNLIRKITSSGLPVIDFLFCFIVLLYLLCLYCGICLLV